MRRRILTVDDIALNRIILKNMLSSDYDILEAEDGETALALLTGAKEPISAVLLDISMPGMDGYEVLRRMRDNAALAQIPVIMITASEDEQSRVRSLTEGANDFVMKPYIPDVIKHCLETNIALYESVITIQSMQRDKLTGLLNREPFFQRVREMVDAQAAGYYVMACFDVDNFKIINDQYGTQKGDEVLRHIGSVFSSGFTPNGGLCCRIMADNFAVLYPASFQSSSEIEALRHRAANIDGLAVPIMFSIGRYAVEDLSLSPSTMYDRANIAATSAKGRYDNKIAQYDDSMRQRLLQEQEIVLEMETALRTQQFEVWFQPQYNHSTAAMIGAEALVRWRHPVKGLIPPGEFIPIFERNGFIYALDKYVWEAVCRYQRRWLDEGRNPLPVSVNISRYDIFRPDMLAFLKGLIETYRLPVDLLRLEITESAFAESEHHIIAVVKALIDYGFTVEIDDFGSGYSSLNTLKDVPAQILKLDMKFLERCGDSERGGNIVESVVRMAKWLDMAVIAEGVETKTQADYLRSIGCSYMQGYLFARPMPAEQYDAHCTGTEKEEHLLKLKTVENLSSNSFWDPDSIDTLIFNSYVGGACIFEYHNGKIELLRATEKYAQIIGSAGMTVEDALKLNWAEHLDTETAKRVVDDLEKSIATNNEVTGEYTFLDLPGCPHETYLRSTMRVIASTGSHYLVYCTNENITAQRQAEKREREVAEEMRLIMANVNSGICAGVRDADGTFRVVFANDRFYGMYGYTKAQMESELGNVLCAVHPDDLGSVSATLDTLLRDKKQVTYEYRCIKRDGSVITVSSNSTIAAFPGIGENVILAVIYDVTARIASEQQMRNLSQQMQSIMDNVDVGIVALIYRQGKPHFLFSNDRYYTMRGYTRAQFEKEQPDPRLIIVPEDRERVKQKTAAIARTGKSAVLVYEITCRDGTRRHIRNTVSIGSFEGIDEPVQLSIFRDITEEKATELREKQANEQAQSIMRDIDSGITATIRKDGKTETLFSNEQYYRMRGYTKAQYHAEVRDFFALIHPDDRERVRKAAVAIYSSKHSLREEYRVILRDGTERWIRVNMTLTRFTGIELPVVVSVYSDVTAEKQAELDIRDAITQLQNMMNDMPGGFVRMSVAEDGSIRPIYFNDGFCKLTGMSWDELMDIYSSDALAGVHPDDVHIVNEAVALMFEKGEAHSARYRLLHKKGGYIWLSIFGRITKDSENNTFLNIYYIDATAQLEEEEKQKALLDNLPGGAGIYELKGNEISLIYQNKSYWELVGLQSEDYPDPEPMSAIHPNDIPVIMQELALAIRQNRDVSCDIQLRHLTLGYRPVHLAGRILPCPGGVFRIYTTFTPISAEGTTYQQMLPLLLSAIMDSTSDLAFSKDTAFCYLSCSRAFAKLIGRDSEREIIGKTDYDLFSRELADKYRRDDIALLAEGKPLIDIVEQIPSEDSVPRYSSTSKYLLRDSVGTVVGIYGVGRDITRSMAQETRLRLMAESIPGGLASYACTSGDFSPEHIRLVYCNDGFCKLFGLTHEEYESRALVNPASLIFEEDQQVLVEQWLCLMKYDTPINCLYRVKVKGGGYKWISHKAVAASRSGDVVIINAILQDVTEQRELIERLRISEEESSLAVGLSEDTIARFIVADRTLTLSADAAAAYHLPQTIRDVPNEPIRLGLIAPESAEVYRSFFDTIIRGSKTATAVFKHKYLGDWRWIEAKSATVFSDAGEPVKAVITLADVTERQEKETIYRKWQQSLDDKPPESYTLYRCSLKDNASIIIAEGTLIAFDFDGAGSDFNERARAYIRACVFEEDRDRYAAFVNADTMLAAYYRGHRSDALDYRELTEDGGVRWLRLTIDLVEYPHSDDVEAYLLYENINEAKLAELQAKARSETDSLTGLLNRPTFIARVEKILRSAKSGSRHALLMLDIDSFKRVNDVFGHGVGDRALVELAVKLRGIIRSTDLLARLGGDEFLFFLPDLPDEGAAARKAQQICAAVHKSFSVEVQITGSVGITMAPQDGTDFNTLYKKADCALYFVKGSGKNSFVFYNASMEGEHLLHEQVPADTPEGKARPRRRILIVDDNAIEHLLLQNIFRDEFIIEKAKNGKTALIRLRHYGSAISAVLLDLKMPGLDGFAVLEQMQQSEQLRSIPVIIVSGDDSRDACLRAIRCGAVDFVTKPVDPEILRIRLHSAVSKAENERLRTANAYLEVQREERLRFEAAIDSVGIAFIEYDWLKGTFLYHTSVANCLLGKYDDRGLWQILLSDMVADTQTVKEMQKLVHAIADDRTKRSGSLDVFLMTPHKIRHRFRMTVRKLLDAYNLTSRLILSLCDMDYDEQPE